jgi:hypothetical protein
MARPLSCGPAPRSAQATLDVVAALVCALAGCGEVILEIFTGFLDVYGFMSNEYGHEWLLNS